MKQRLTNRLDQFHPFPILRSCLLSSSSARTIIDACFAITGFHKAFSEKHSRQVVFTIIPSNCEVVGDGIVYELFLLRREFALAKVD